METDPQSASEPASATAISCAVVPEGWSDEPCPMYEVRELAAGGARLAGLLLLEVDEEVLLELGFPDGTRVRARARVVVVDRKARPGVVVEFVELDEQAREAIAARSTAPAEEQG